MCGNKIRDLVEAGFHLIIFLADVHSMINRKFGGDLEKIRRAGEYVKHCFTALGLGPDKVEFRWASELADSYRYWDRVLQVARNASIQRVTRALPIMGRSMSPGEVETAFLFYPCMQVADIFELGLDVACAGIDQRKAHMLARDVAEKTRLKKPICIHTPLLMGLSKAEGRMDLDEDPRLSQEISLKMSKSIPKGAIYIHDEPEEIKAKIRAAYCPPREVEANPIIQIARYLILDRGKTLHIDRSSKYGGPITLYNYGELAEIYGKGDLHPLDLKNGVAEALIEILHPVREYFKTHREALEIIKGEEITR